MNSGNNYGSGGNIYDGVESIGGIGGEFLGLKFPYRVRVTRFHMMSYVTSTSSRGAKEGYLMGRNNGGEWQQVHFFQNKIFKAYQYTTFEFENDTFYDEYTLVVTKTTGATVWNASELRYFGTREQGQSVLHDGQLTLTKSLNVPRIGPALDADDTPRRDRLVVEYNTSTNPTFEGAVRDTSGRGNDGMFYGGAYYDANEKALKFDGTDDYIFTGNIGNHAGAWIHSYSVWINLNDYTNENIVLIGQDASGNKASSLKVNNSTAIHWFFFGNDVTFTHSMTLGSWYHIAAVYDGGAPDSSRRMWINGTELTVSLAGAGTALNLSANAEMRIGRRQSYEDHFNGEMSQFKLYDTSLTAEEVKTLYDMGRCDEGHHVVNFSKTRVGIGLGDGEAPRGALDVRGDIYGGCPVFFHARRTTHAESTAGAGFDPLIWQSALNNKGGGYSTTTGKFTAPIAGFYEFFYGGMSVNLDDSLEVIPKLNNVDYPGPTIYVSPDSSQQHRYAMATAIVEMKVGDTWHIRLPAGAVGLYGTGNSYNMFTGKLLSTVGGGGGGY